MEDSYFGKVVFFEKEKQFGADDGDLTHKLSEAIVYPEYNSDEGILQLFDFDYRKDIKIWKVRITVETVE